MRRTPEIAALACAAISHPKEVSGRQTGSSSFSIGQYPRLSSKEDC